jgi:hypothetical protein
MQSQQAVERNTLKRKAEYNWRSHVDIVEELDKGHCTVVSLLSDSESEPESVSQGMADDVSE